MIPHFAKWKNLFFYFIMFSLILSSSLLLSEVILRLSGRIAVKGLHTASEEVFNNIPGIFEPDQNFIYKKKPALPFHVSINSLGFRGSEIDIKKNPGTSRILFLGDSLTFGEFVNDDETFPYKLQMLFREKEESVEVVNGGVGGTTIVDQLYFLKRNMDIDPDIIVLTFFLNDIPDLNRAVPLFEKFENNRKLKSSFIIGSIFSFLGDTALFQLGLQIKVQWKYYYKLFFSDDKNTSENSNLNNEAILQNKYAGLLKDMHKYLTKYSVDFLLVIFPSHHQIGEKTKLTDLYDQRVMWIEELSKENGIPVVNILNIFKQKNFTKNQLYLLPDDGHPSNFAYTLTAKAIFESIQDNFSDFPAIQ